MRRFRSATTAAASALALMGLALLPSASGTATPRPPAPGDPVIVAAGDIACRRPCAGVLATAALIQAIDPTAVLPLGDNQYPDGKYWQYRRSYDPTWGAFLGRTFPVPGNHEYFVPGARGYFRYFESRLVDGARYYSYNLGEWHLVALNSKSGRAPHPDQLRWLRGDLYRDDHLCQLAYWHHPRFSSGIKHGSNPTMGWFWRTLQRHGVDVVLNGHEHNYEQFRRMLPSGELSHDGIREFVVGTGGLGTYGFKERPIHTSRARVSLLGVLRMDLHATRYAWSFETTDGTTADSGSTACH